MITKTSEIAIQSMVYLALKGARNPIPPVRIAQVIGCSPSYLRKTMGQLVKAGLLTSRRGPHGGMVLARAAEEVTIHAIVEACEGLVIGAYCRAIGDSIGPVCAYHRAMWDIRQATINAMMRWTLADLVSCPLPEGELAGNRECVMDFLREP